MKDRADISLSEAEKTALYSAFLINYGWPVWPPQETPASNQSRWWEENIAQLPEHKPTPFPSIVAFEINGLPNSGKSTLEKDLAGTIKSKLDKRKMGHVQIRILGDQLVGTPFVVQDLSLLALGECDDYVPPIWEKQDLLTTLQLQVNKTNYWERVMGGSIQFY